MARERLHSRGEVISGLFVVAALFIFGLFAFKVGRFDLMGLLKPPALEARTYFLDVKSLQEGALVRVGGRRVGEVRKLNLVDRHWPNDDGGEATHRLVNEVVFELSEPSLRIHPPTASVSIGQDSPLSPHFLVLDPGRWPAGERPAQIFEAGLEEGFVLPGREALGFEDLVAKAEPAIDELVAILETLNDRVLAPENMERVGEIFDDLSATIASTRQVVERLDRDLLKPDTLEAVSRTLLNLDATLADSRRVVGRLDRLLDPEQDPRLDTILTDVAGLTSRLDRDLGETRAQLEQLLETTELTVSATSAEVSEALRRLQRALWQGEMALRKIRANPAVLLFGDDETDLEARDLDLTRIRLDGRARPYEQRDEREDPER